MTGEAIITLLVNIKSIEGADKIVSAELCGETVIISKEYKEGTIGVLFDCETQLSHEFCSYNNLYRDSTKNKDETVKGYIEDSRRIMPIKLKGVKCSGLWLPLDSLAYIKFNVRTLQIGSQFKELAGSVVCNKYVPQVRESNNGSKSPKTSKGPKAPLVENFYEHVDSDQLLRNVQLLKNGFSITITEKLHGCVKHDTMVTLQKLGKKTIKEVVDNKLNDNILAYNVFTQKDEFVPISNFYTIPNDGEWYEIELENGKKITITGNNPVWLPEFGIYRRVDELDGSEYLQIS